MKAQVNGMGFWTEYRRTQTDVRKCSDCKEPIYSDMYIMVLASKCHGEEHRKELDIVLCQACKEMNDEQ